MRGALQAKVRLGSLDPEDYEGRLTAASARIEMGDKGGALSDLKEIAGELADKGRQPEAIEVLREAAKLNPDDEEIREKLLDVYFAAGDFARARECATHRRAVPDDRRGARGGGQRRRGARDAAAGGARSIPPTPSCRRSWRARSSRAAISRPPREYLTAETAGDDPELLLTVADIQLRGDKFEEGLAIVRRLLERIAARREQIAQLGWSVAEKAPEAGFQVVELAADAAVAQVDWPGAAAVLQEFVTRVPNHIPALMRLVEICVDGGLEATMYSAQAQLADAYIEGGQATEARFIAEDLVAREPWDKANIERFRRTLVLLGEPDPDALIAARLSGESPFMSTDLSRRLAVRRHPAASRRRSRTKTRSSSCSPPRPSPTSRSKKAPLKPLPRRVERGASLRAERERDRSRQHPRRLRRAGAAARRCTPTVEDVEVDLSIVLDAVKKPRRRRRRAARRRRRSDLDSVFGSMRTQSAKRSGLDDAEKEYKRGLALRAAGDIDGAIAGVREGVARAEAAVRHLAADRAAVSRSQRRCRRRSSGWSARRRRRRRPPTKAHQLLYELAEALETGRRDRARARRLHGAAGRRRRRTATSTARSIASPKCRRGADRCSAGSSTSSFSSRSACCSS